MVIKGVVRKGEYFDSVTLMRAAKEIGGYAGVADSAVVMATPENMAILEHSGLLLKELEAAAPADLIIAVKADTAASADAALVKAAAALKGAKPVSASAGAKRAAASLDSALAELPGANMAVISVAGRYAGDVALDALKKGLNVMLFSDNVPLEKEIQLKRYAESKGLIVMGPDCGTAIINGVPLAFANAVNRGDIGIVAAAGTGLQEVSTLISNAGGGISQAFGTGGRDVKKDVGGISFLQALSALADDPGTRVIALVSKPPHAEVLAKIITRCKTIKKPIAAVFLGGDASLLKGTQITSCETLEEAAYAAISLCSCDKARPQAEKPSALAGIAKAEAALKKPGQKYVRGLFSGGTFVSEAQLILGPLLGAVRSNAPLDPDLKLKNPLSPQGHSVVDLGEDEFTVGRPHPMIDYSLRSKLIAEEAAKPETSVILLDVVIGYGANLKPADELCPVIAAAIKTASDAGRRLSVVCSVTGTDADPQNRGSLVRALQAAGALVMRSNASACRLAGLIAKSAKGGRK